MTIKKLNNNDFLAGRSFTLKQIIEKKVSIRRNQPIPAICQSNERHIRKCQLLKLQEAMERTNINRVLIKTTKKQYQHSKKKVKVGIKITKVFHTNTGHNRDVPSSHCLKSI